MAGVQLLSCLTGVKTALVFSASYIHVRKGRTTSIILLDACNTNTDELCTDVCMQMHVRPDNICHVDDASRRRRHRHRCVWITSEHVVGRRDEAVIFTSFCGVTAVATSLNIQQPADFYMI